MSQPPEDLHHSPSTAADAQQSAAQSGGSGSTLMYVLVLLLAAVVLIGVIYFDPLSHRGSSRGGPALTSLTLESLANEDIKLTLDDLKDKVVLINFWGTWCGPCRVEFPEIVALEKQYRGRSDVLVLAVSCGPPNAEDAESRQLKDLRLQTQAFMDQRGVDMPMYIDPGFQTRKVVESLGLLQSYPTTLLLDGQHRVMKRWMNPAHKADFEAAIEELLQRS
jgi:thiol-disulfide isomerase/thioredoxin